MAMLNNQKDPEGKKFDWFINFAHFGSFGLTTPVGFRPSTLLLAFGSGFGPPRL